MPFMLNLFLEETLRKRKCPVAMFKQFGTCTRPTVVSSLCFEKFTIRPFNWKPFLLVSGLILSMLNFLKKFSFLPLNQCFCLHGFRETIGKIVRFVGTTSSLITHEHFLNPLLF